MCNYLPGEKSSIFSLIRKRQNRHVKSTHQEFLLFSKLLYPKFQHVNSYGNEEDHLACDIAFSPHGRIITSGGYHGDVCAHDSVTGKKIFQQDNAHIDIINEILYISSEQFATASSDRTAKVWDVRKVDYPVLSFTGHMGPVKSLGFDEESSRLLTTSMDGRICWWSVNKSGPQQEDNLLLKCTDLTLSNYSPKHNILVFCTTSMMFVIKNIDLKHVSDDLKVFWERGVFTADFREHGMWVSTLQDKQRNSVTAFSEDECTPVPNSKTKGFHCLVIHPTKQAMVATINTQQDIFGSTSEFVVLYDVSRHGKNNGLKCEPVIEHLFSAGDEIMHHKIRYYSPLRRFRRSQVPAEVVDRRKKFALSQCGRVIAAPNVDKVNLFAISPTISEPFEDIRTETANGTALGLLELISDGGPQVLHNICELPVVKGTIPICCKFSPRDMLLAVNGFGDKVTLYQPRL